MSNCKFKIIQKYLRRVGEKLVSYWMPASFFIYNSFTRRKSHTKVGRNRSVEIGFENKKPTQKLE